MILQCSAVDARHDEISSDPLVSVIVPWWDHDELLVLWEQNMRHLAGVDIIFVDNGSAVRAKESLKSFCKKYDIRLIRNEINLGFSAANNQGAVVAKGKYLFFLNNDVEIYRLPFTDICAKTGSGVFGPKASNQDGFTYAEGWALCIKRSTFDAIGGWCEDFGCGYWDDVDISIRAERAGYSLTLSCDPFDWINHIGNITGCDGRFDQRALDGRNRSIFFKRHFADIPPFLYKEDGDNPVSENSPEILKKRCLVVLGVHRSGTSAITGMLNLLGIAVGKGLMNTAEDNPKGFFELYEVAALHNRLLESLGGSWSDERYLPLDWLNRSDIEQIKAQLESVLLEEFGGRGIFTVKDPRMCRLLPLWLEIFDRQGITALFIIITRHPEEVSASLYKRNNIPVNQAMMLWLSHLLEAERLTRGCSRIIVDYTDLLRDWKSVVRQLEKTFDMTFKVPSEDAESRIAEFIDPGLRHHYAAIDRLEEKNQEKTAASLAYDLYGVLTDKSLSDKSAIIDMIYLKYLHRLV